jgi:GDP-L-fucose synthase
MIDLSKSRVCVTGGAGFLGRYLVAELQRKGCKDIFVPRSADYDLRDEADVQCMIADSQADIVIHAAAHAGGIGLNNAKPAELFYDNLMMGMLMMDVAHDFGVEKYVQIGTICAYPKFTSVPFCEDDLWNGYPEDTNAPYGIAKKSLLVMAQAYRKQYGFNAIYLLPVNMYGPNDNFDLQSSHVIPALIRKFIEAKNAGVQEVIIWGDGSASREFLYVKDCAEAVVKATEFYDEGDPVNIGVGSEIAIKDLVTMISNKVGYGGRIFYDTSKPNGQPRRCLDTRKAAEKFGFKATTDLSTGLDETIAWYKEKQNVDVRPE